MPELLSPVSFQSTFSEYDLNLAAEYQNSPIPPVESSVASVLVKPPGPAWLQPVVEPLYSGVYPVSGRQSAFTCPLTYRRPPSSCCRKFASV